MLSRPDGSGSAACARSGVGRSIAVVSLLGGSWTQPVRPAETVSRTAKAKNLRRSGLTGLPIDDYPARLTERMRRTVGYGTFRHMAVAVKLLNWNLVLSPRTPTAAPALIGAQPTPVSTALINCWPPTDRTIVTE